MVVKELFGKTLDGKDVTLYTLTNKNGMKAQIMNYGAILVRLYLPDGKGGLVDVVEGYDTMEPYYENGGNYGAVVGPHANRIGNATFALNGVTYQLEVNDGPNNLHSDFNHGFQKHLWNVEIDGDALTFTTGKEDMELGFPGKVNVSVTYTLTDDNELRLVYDATADKPTPLNLTNHSYFNLAGQGSGTILDHEICIKASKYTDVEEGAIPNGELPDVTGTPMDLRTMKRIGDDIDADFKPLVLCSGYDQNFVVDGYDGSYQKIAEVLEPQSKRRMEVYSTLPGVQFYAGNYTGDHEGKAGKRYGKRSALCLETQYYPDSVNHANFPSVIFGPDRDWHSVTGYKFFF